MSTQQGAREWILRKGDFQATELILNKMMLYNGQDYYHVIEKAAYDRLAAELETAKQKNETHLELIKLYRSEIHYLKHEKTNTREEIDKMRELLYQTHGNGD